MASNVANLGKIPELRKRIIYTLTLLAVYRAGVFITVPGVNREVMSNYIQNAAGGFLGLFNMFSGGAIEQLSIFALGVMPYISASIIFQLLNVVVPSLERLNKEGERGTVRPGGRLDHVGNDLLLRFLVEIVERLAAELGMLLEVVVGPVRNSFQFAPAHREEVLDIDAPLRVVSELVLCVVAQLKVLFSDAVFLVPVEPFVDPFLVPLFIRSGLDEELDLHLFELAGPEGEVAGRNFVSEAFADLADPERKLLAGGLKNVREVDEDPLRRFGAKVDGRRRIFYGPELGRKHEVCGLRVRKDAATGGADRAVRFGQFFRERRRGLFGVFYEGKVFPEFSSVVLCPVFDRLLGVFLSEALLDRFDPLGRFHRVVELVGAEGPSRVRPSASEDARRLRDLSQYGSGHVAFDV